mmetsp:Transcript_43526/g.135417  ORF Transcript_43526/g.135417 Transcript_43526/m.135417 type:complete len:278 (-) Transcript_43526:15-848(-)
MRPAPPGCKGSRGSCFRSHHHAELLVAGGPLRVPLGQRLAVPQRALNVRLLASPQLQTLALSPPALEVDPVPDTHLHIRHRSVLQNRTQPYSSRLPNWIASDAATDSGASQRRSPYVGSLPQDLHVAPLQKSCCKLRIHKVTRLRRWQWPRIPAGRVARHRGVQHAAGGDPGPGGRHQHRAEGELRGPFAAGPQQLRPGPLVQGGVGAAAADEAPPVPAVCALQAAVRGRGDGIPHEVLQAALGNAEEAARAAVVATAGHPHRGAGALASAAEPWRV